MNSILRFFKRFDYPVSTHSLGLFRILYAAYNLGLIIQLYGNWELYFDAVAPFSYSLFPVKLGLLMWTLSNIFLISGSFTRYAAFANYVMVVLMTSYFPNMGISSFNDDLLRIGGFMLIILPASRSFSVDAIRARVSLSNKPSTTSYLYYLLAILVSLGLLYFGSGYTKLFSPMWQKGIGLWIPTVLPDYRWNSFNLFADSQWFMYFMNYLVILFELAFVFLIFYKRFHPYLAIIGIGFHLGIALLFPFYYISFGPIIYYTLFIPDTWWRSLKRLGNCKHPAVIRYNPHIAKHLHAVGLLKSLNAFTHYTFLKDEATKTILVDQTSGWPGIFIALRKNALLFPCYLLFKTQHMRNVAEYASECWLPQTEQQLNKAPETIALLRFTFFVFVTGLCGVQVLTWGYHTYTAIKADKQKLALYLKKRIAVQDFSSKPSNLARTFFGVNSRGLFLDHAFIGSKTAFALAQVNQDGSETWIPVFNKEGYCEKENMGFRWHKLSFKYLGKTQTQPDTSGLKKYTWLWAKKNHKNVQNLEIRVYRRIYPCPTEYEKGYLTKMLATPWDTIGTIHWHDSIFSYENLKPDKVFNQ